MAATSLECVDFLEFQDALQQMRQIDDKIIYMLNTTIPTESFKGQVNPTDQCKQLYEQIEIGHAQRENAIRKCVNNTKEKVNELRHERDNGGENNPVLLKNLRKEQTTLRMLQGELNVEEVVKKRTLQVYYERCRMFYKPPKKDS